MPGPSFDIAGTFLLLVIAQLIGDFVLQGPLAEHKRGFNRHMIAHASIMSLAFFVPVASYPTRKTVLATAIIFVSHMIIDASRVEVNRLLELDPERYLFWALLGVDQIVHISIIYLLFTQMVAG